MPIKLSLVQFIQKANKIHGNKYDYSLAQYINSSTKTIIICSIHGEFSQTPNNHLSGKGCNLCADINRKTNNCLTSKQFIAQVSVTHKNKYDYSLLCYVNSSTKIKIICPVHGEFLQLPNNHSAGKGCSKCKNEKTSVRCSHTKEQFIAKAVKIHKNKYDYSEVRYKKDNLKIKLICKKHGEFLQTPRSHLNGNGCPKCAGFNTTIAEFANKARSLHKDKYDYVDFSYITSKKQSTIICPVHGPYFQSAEVHLRGSGCPKCVGKISKGEIELSEWLKSLDIVVKTSDRTLIAPKELDIVLPEYKIAIEYNGLYWHSSAMKNFNKFAMKEKYESCKKLGYRLIHVFSDDWKFKREIVKSILCTSLGKVMDKVFARKCHCGQISKHEAKLFLDKHHIQGAVNSSIAIGLFYKQNLSQVMLFKKDKESFNLVRFVTKKSLIVVGGASKVFKYFCTNNEFESIYTFADLSTFSGKLYEILGFTKEKEIPIDYSYVYQGRRKHKFGFRRKRLKTLLHNFDETKSELENTVANNIYRIYDCGKIKYKYLK